MITLVSAAFSALARGMRNTVTAMNGTRGWKNRLHRSPAPRAVIVRSTSTVAQPAASRSMGCAPTLVFVTRFCSEFERSMPRAMPSTSTGAPKRMTNLPRLMGSGLKMGTSSRSW